LTLQLLHTILIEVVLKGESAMHNLIRLGAFILGITFLSTPAFADEPAYEGINSRIAKHGAGFRTDDIVLLWKCGSTEPQLGMLVVFTNPSASAYDAFLQGVEAFVIKRTIPTVPHGVTVFFALRGNRYAPFLIQKSPPIDVCKAVSLSYLPSVYRSRENRAGDHLIVVLSRDGKELLRIEGGPAWGAFAQALANMLEQDVEEDQLE
jgi:hypothetical protein